MSKASGTMQGEMKFLSALLIVFLVLPGCSKKSGNQTKLPAPMLYQKSIDGISVRAEQLKCQKPLRAYQQLRIAITNTTNSPLRLSGSQITLPLASASTLKKHARGLHPATNIINITLFGAGLIFAWPLCLASIATTGISYQLQKVSSERRIGRQAHKGFAQHDILDVAARSTQIIDLFIHSSYVPAFSMTFWQGNKPVVFLIRTAL
jgi:hypothetical protein